jgi:hypothetical protein
MKERKKKREIKERERSDNKDLRGMNQVKEKKNKV